MRFALLSTVASVTVAQLQALATASEPELARVAEAWSVVDSTIVVPTVRVVGAVGELTDEDTPILLVPQLPPEDGMDMAFHSLKADRNGVQRPYGVVLAEVGMPWETISQGAFHEMAETVGDPNCDQYIAGRSRENCDPVQEDGIVRNGVLLSAWVPPAWFGIGMGPCAFSDVGFTLAPYQLRPGGYVQFEDGHQEPPGYRPLPHKAHRHSRAARRQRAWEMRATLQTGAPMVKP